MSKHSRCLPSAFYINLRRIICCYVYIALEWLSCHSDFIHEMMLKKRIGVLENETTLAGIRKEDKILHIGSGIYPYQSIAIAKDIGAHITALDINRTAVRLSRDHILSEGLEDFITVECCDGSIYPIGDHTVVIIAINVWPVDKVFLHIDEQAKPGTRILARSLWHDIPDLLNLYGLTERYMVLAIMENDISPTYLLKKNA